MRREDELVHDQVIAHEDVLLHRRGRHLESLEEEGPREEGEDDRHQERVRPLAERPPGGPPRFGVSARPEHPVPSGPREEVDRHVGELPDLRRRSAPDVGVRLGLVGPVEDRRPAENVFARDRSPVAAVERVVAVVPHPEPVVRRHGERAELVAAARHVRNGRVVRVHLGVAVLNGRPSAGWPLTKRPCRARRRCRRPCDRALDEHVAGVDVVARLLENDDVAGMDVAVGEELRRAPAGAARRRTC